MTKEMLTLEDIKPHIWSEKNSHAPSSYSRSSSKKVFFQCDAGHEWEKQISEFKRYKNCPYCSILERHNVVAGENDLASTHPEVAKLWSSKNKFPSWVYSAKSTANVFWSDEVHKVSIVSKIAKMNSKHGNTRFDIADSVAVLYPEMAQMFAPDSPIKADEITPWSRNEVKFQCKEPNHVWTEKMRYFFRRKGVCAVCSRAKIIAGVNDLETTHPDLTSEWDDERSIHEVHYGSSYKATWKCSVCHHRWKAEILSRVNGTGCASCAGKVAQPGVNDLATIYSHVVQAWSEKNSFQPHEVPYGSERLCILNCTKDGCNGSQDMPAYLVARRRHMNLPFMCSSCQSSQGESSLGKVLNILVNGDEVIRGSRKVLNGLELDFYIPSKKIAFEFNGVYWHSEANGKGSTYHADKTAECRKQGIQLIHVWEDDWRDRRDIVVRSIAAKMGALDLLKEDGTLINYSEDLTQSWGARQLTPTVVNPSLAKKFLIENHLQGSSHGTLHMGLLDKDDVIRALLTVKRIGNTGRNGEWSIERYATRGIVSGGFTRLISHAAREIQAQKLGSLTRWITFSDNAISDGGLYKNSGFINEADLPADYTYLINSRRVHKFNYRLSRFRKDPNLVFEEGKSERELAELNGITRIWDAGKKRWIKDLTG